MQRIPSIPLCLAVLLGSVLCGKIYEPTARVKHCVEVTLDPANETLNEDLPSGFHETDYEYCRLALKETVNNMEVHRLLEKGHDPNTPLDEEGRTRLILAVIAGEKEIAAELLNFGQMTSPAIDVNARAVSGHSALHYAGAKGYGDLSMMLLAHNADPNAQITGDRKKHSLMEHRKYKTGWAPLHFAAQAGLARVVKLLLEKDADATLKTQLNETALDLLMAQPDSKVHPETKKEVAELLGGADEEENNLDI